MLLYQSLENRLLWRQSRGREVAGEQHSQMHLGNMPQGGHTRAHTQIFLAHTKHRPQLVVWLFSDCLCLCPPMPSLTASCHVPCNGAKCPHTHTHIRCPGMGKCCPATGFLKQVEIPGLIQRPQPPVWALRPGVCHLQQRVQRPGGGHDARSGHCRRRGTADLLSLTSSQIHTRSNPNKHTALKMHVASSCPEIPKLQRCQTGARNRATRSGVTPCRVRGSGFWVVSAISNP